MTPQELKASILQLAIQGKLVEQRPEEGSGGELLERIFAAKNAKDAKGAKKSSRAETPRRRGKADAASSREEIPDSEKPFEVPDSWGWGRLGNCCEMYTGNSISESEKRAKYEGQKEGLAYIATKDVSFEQVICYDNGVKIPFANAADFRRAEKDTILMCVEGGSAGRKIAILDREVCFGNKLCMFKPKAILNTYLFFYLQSLEFKKQFSDNLSGIIGGVSIKKLKEIVFPIPPLAEQKRIVAKIEELLPYIDRYEKAWSKLEDFNKRFPGDMQKSLLQMAIQGKLVDQRPEEGIGEELYRQIQSEKQRLIKSGKNKKEKPLPEITSAEIPFDIPESWVWLRFGEVGELKNGYAFKSTEYTRDGIQVVRISDLGDNCIGIKDAVYYPQKEELNPYIIVDGSFLICMTGSIGKMAWVRDGVLRYLNQRVGMFIPSRMCVPAYLWYFLHTDHVVNGWIRAKTSANGNIKCSDITHLCVPLPPLAEQKRIVAKLEELLPLCERLKGKGLA